MSRFRAFAIHLGLSVLIFVGLAYLVIYQWYPDFFFDTDGGWRGMRIIVFVDLVLGPSLTLVVYKAGKPGLRTDLTLIGVLQIACLVAGTYVVYSERPLVVVYNDSRFSVMSSDDFTSIGLPVPDLDKFPGHMPKWVMVEIPTGMQAEADFRRGIIGSGRTISTVTELYQPFRFEHGQVRGNPQDPAKIFAKENRQPLLQQWLRINGGKVDDYLFYNLASRFTYGVLIFDQASGNQAGLIDFTDSTVP